MNDVSIRHRLEYLFVRLGLCHIQQMPVDAALAMAENAGWLACRVLKRRARIGRENIAAAFPEKTPEEVDRLLLAVCRNLFRTVVEVPYLRRLVKPSTWQDYVEVENFDDALDVILEGRGGILVSGHFGNWEFMGHVLPYLGVRSSALARPLDNPLLDRYLLGVRESGLQRIILKRGSGSIVEDTLAGGGFVSILVDQDAGGKGVFVPFFGRLASTWRSAALLSQKTGAPILPGCCVRTGRGLRFRMIVGRPICPDSSADVTSETLRMTLDFTRQLEGWIRQWPEQYLWLHRRWKSVPGRRSLVAGRDYPAGVVDPEPEPVAGAF